MENSRILTDLHLSLDSGLAPVSVVDLCFVVIIHDLDELPRDRGVLQGQKVNVSGQVQRLTRA